MSRMSSRSYETAVRNGLLTSLPSTLRFRTRQWTGWRSLIACFRWQVCHNVGEVPAVIHDLSSGTCLRLMGMFFSLKSMRHPWVVWDCISNDVLLHDQYVQILTYSNASGQSTFARICCVAVILPQLDCYLPAEEAVLMVFNQILTWISAGYYLFSGQLRFMPSSPKRRGWCTTRLRSPLSYSLSSTSSIHFLPFHLFFLVISLSLFFVLLLSKTILAILSLASWLSKSSNVNFGIQDVIHKNVRDRSPCQDDRQLEDVSSFPVPIPRFFSHACRRTDGIACWASALQPSSSNPSRNPANGCAALTLLSSPLLS
jgi:hypothetical protein